MKKFLIPFLALALLLTFSLGEAHANQWNDRMRTAYHKDGFPAGILPWGSEEFVINVPTEFIYLAKSDELKTKDVSGKIVLLDGAGDESYDDLVTLARTKKAVALLIGEADRNKRRSEFRDELSNDNKTYPMMLLDSNQVAYLKPHSGEKLMTERPHEDTMNTYSSWGISSDFVFNPDLIAPGTVYAPFSRLNPNDPEKYPAFGVLEGTSMSTPTVAGGTVLVKEYLEKIAPNLRGDNLTRAIRTQLQNTALAHRDKDLKLTTPRWQGAGNLDVGLATSNPILIHTPYNANDTESGMGKVNLRDSIRAGGPSEGVINFSLDMDNLSAEDVTLKNAEAVLLVDKVVDKRVGQGSKEVARIPLGENLKVPATGSSNLPVRIDFRRYLDNEMKEIKDASPNGFFVEGFVISEYYNKTLKKTVELSVPFIGFYGDWFAVPVIERSIYDRGRDDIPYYGPFSGIKQDGGGDFVTAFPKPYFAHVAGILGKEDVVLGADWDFDLADLKSVETEMVDGEERYVGPRTPKNPAVRKDKIAVSLKGNGARNIRFKSPAMRNWLESRLELCTPDGKVLLTDEHGNNGMNEKHYKDLGQYASSSAGDVEDDNKIRRRTEFGALDLDKIPNLQEGKYVLRFKVRPDAVNMHNPVAEKDAAARDFKSYWQEIEFPLIIDSKPPRGVMATSEEIDGENSKLTISATDDLSGVKSYELLDSFGERIEMNNTGVFKVKTSDIESLKVKISDFAYNSISEKVSSRLNMGDTGSLTVETTSDDSSFKTAYYAVSKSDPTREYTDLTLLPVGDYYVYLLNPSAGFSTDTYQQEVSIKKDQLSKLKFTFRSDPDQKFYLDLKTDLTFEQYEDRLPGLKGANYELQLTDTLTHMRYVYPPVMNGLSEIHTSINHGKYEYSMPGLRVWKDTDPGWSADNKDWKLGIQDDDGYGYTSDVPRSDRPKPLESINTRDFIGHTLEYYFYESRPDPAIATPILPDNPNKEYRLGADKIVFELHEDRKQNPDQFRLLLPSRLADDEEIQDDYDESMLINFSKHSIEITSYADDYFSAEKQSGTGRTRVTITIPPLIQKKLKVGDELFIQEMDKAWKPYPDSQIKLKVVSASGASAGGVTGSSTSVHIPSGNARAVALAANSSVAPAAPTQIGAISSPDKEPVAYIRPRVKERLNERIGHTQAHRNGYTGKGQLIAIIDNGIEFAHPSFQKAAANPSDNKIADANALSKRIAAAKSGSYAGKLSLEGRYINEKIPYAYNYYVRGSDQDSMLAGGGEAFEHGAHVAGIAAANPNYDGYPADLPKFMGVAPEAQLAIMSVASPSGFTADSAQYFAQAIYDAVALGADTISVSMGIGAGTTLNVDQNFRDAVAYAQSQGVVVNFATGNSGFFGRGLPPTDQFASKYLYDLNIHPYAENPDYGTVDAPAVFDAVNSVSAYGADLYPPIDTPVYNPAIDDYQYTRPDWSTYLRPRLYLAPKEEDPEEDSTPAQSSEDSTETPPNSGQAHNGKQGSSPTVPHIPKALTKPGDLANTGLADTGVATVAALATLIAGGVLVVLRRKTFV